MPGIVNKCVGDIDRLIVRLNRNIITDDDIILLRRVRDDLHYVADCVDPLIWELEYGTRQKVASAIIQNS